MDAGSQKKYRIIVDHHLSLLFLMKLFRIIIPWSNSVHRYINKEFFFVLMNKKNGKFIKMPIQKTKKQFNEINGHLRQNYSLNQNNHQSSRIHFFRIYFFLSLSFSLLLSLSLSRSYFRFLSHTQKKIPHSFGLKWLVYGIFWFLGVFFSFLTLSHTHILIVFLYLVQNLL